MPAAGIMALLLLCLTGCGKQIRENLIDNFTYQEPTYPLVENYEICTELFEEQNVEARRIYQDEKEYLQLTFPDDSIAIYRSGLERIEKPIEKEEDGEICPGVLKLKIKSEETALLYVIWEEGITNGEFVLPDFSEMLPSRALKQDDGCALLLIESWISEEEAAKVYQQAKEMEQLMLSYQAEKMDTDQQKSTGDKESENRFLMQSRPGRKNIRQKNYTFPPILQ